VVVVAKYLVLFGLTGETMKRFIAKPSDRAAVVRELAESGGAARAARIAASARGQSAARHLTSRDTTGSDASVSHSRTAPAWDTRPGRQRT
jgi:hypothetical protein